MIINNQGQKTTDFYWIEQYRLGNRHAMGVLYQRYFQKVYQKCLSFSKDPAQAFDLAQDVLLKAFDHLHAFKGNSSFSTWLYTITYNHYREFCRKAKRLVVLPLGIDYPDQDQRPDLGLMEGAAGQENSQNRLMDLLNNLTETDKKMLLLKYYQGRSIENLQQQFDLSAGAVKMRLKRARHRLNSLYRRAVA
jgi:RNA polymerase sigma-70 factor (ECF subfamily)